MKLNETPIRTSRNFNINNITLENFNMPEDIREFSNVQIIEDSSKIEIDSNTNKIDLGYGLGDLFTSQVNQNANINININVNSKTNNESQINFEFDEDNNNLVENIQITANENTKSTFIIKYLSDDNTKSYHNGIINVNAKDNSEINIIIVNLINQNSSNFLAIQNNIEDNAKVKYTIIDFGGNHSITNYYSNIIGNSADNKLNTIYLGKDDQIFDLNYIGELRGKESNIDIEVQGALKDKAKKHFKGTIDFKKGCKKAVGNENENCMLLSDTAKSIALPMLLCSEEDVKGNHSASAGKVGEKELFYIMSRGFSVKEAQKLLVRANFNKILESIKNEGLRELILEKIDERLD